MDDLLLAPETSSFDLMALVAQFGENPLFAMGWLITHGGWIIILWAVLWGLREVWLDYRQGKFMAKQKWVLLAIDVPKNTEQTVKAVDNMFAYLAGAHSSASFLEVWWEGKVQPPISLELISIEGHIQYLIYTTRKTRDLVEAAIYSQYPDAEITEVEDYVHHVPHDYPNATHDCFSLEMEPVKSDVYPLKTYVDFEDSMTKEFKDPLAAMLETFSRLGPGEQAWYQIIMVPIAQKEFPPHALHEIRKITGQKEEHKKTMLDKALDAPIDALSMAGNVVFGAGEEGGHQKEENPMNSRMWNLTPGERKIVEGIERKMSKIVFQCKIRFAYIARKEVFDKYKIAYSFVGALKQYNTNDMQALKPDSKHVGVSSSLVFFKDKRNNVRKTHLVHAYEKRSSWRGLPKFHMNTEELASLWHLPVSLFVKAPQVKKTESKKTEPPINLPM